MASGDEKDRTFFEYYEDDEFEDDEEFIDGNTFNETLNPPNFSTFESTLIPIEERTVDDSSSRRLFQRLWTDEDEMVILEGFLDFVTRRGTTHANYQHDTGPFYEQIKTKIQLDFNKNQLIEKLRRLKKKYRSVDNRMKSKGQDFVFRSDHERATYEISRQIWSNTAKRPRNRRYSNAETGNVDVDDNAIAIASNGVLNSEEQITQSMPMVKKQSCLMPSVIEETVKCCLSPLLKELLQYGRGIGGADAGLLLNSLPLCLSNGNGLGNLPMGLDGDKWKQQQILELEVYLKRVELLEEQIKATLEELRSSLTTMKTEA